jgi:hypothetical protein
MEYVVEFGASFRLVLRRGIHVGLPDAVAAIEDHDDEEHRLRSQ